MADGETGSDVLLVSLSQKGFAVDQSFQGPKMLQRQRAEQVDEGLLHCHKPLGSRRSRVLEHRVNATFHRVRFWRQSQMGRWWVVQYPSQGILGVRGLLLGRLGVFTIVDDPLGVPKLRL